MTDNGSGKQLRVADIQHAMSVYGADAEQWPDEIRDAARALLASSPTLGRILEQEMRFEEELRPADPLPFNDAQTRAPDLAARIIRAAARTAQEPGSLSAPPPLSVNAANHIRLTPETKRGFTLLPEALKGAAARLRSIGAFERKTPSSARALPPPGKQAFYAPAAYTPAREQRSCGVSVCRLPSFPRFAAGAAAFMIAGFALGLQFQPHIADIKAAYAEPVYDDDTVMLAGGEPPADIWSSL